MCLYQNVRTTRHPTRQALVGIDLDEPIPRRINGAERNGDGCLQRNVIGVERDARNFHSRKIL